MLAVVECSIPFTRISTPVISFFIPQGDHAETYALQGLLFDSELEQSVTMSARLVSFLTGDGERLAQRHAFGLLCRRPGFDSRRASG